MKWELLYVESLFNLLFLCLSPRKLQQTEEALLRNPRVPDWVLKTTGVVHLSHFTNEKLKLGGLLICLKNCVVEEFINKDNYGFLTSGMAFFYSIVT